MRFATYEQHGRRLATVEDDGVLYPCPGAGSREQPPLLLRDRRSPHRWDSLRGGRARTGVRSRQLGHQPLAPCAGFESTPRCRYRGVS
ncbi:hypothetical protein C9J60_05150 [Streptomyces sp. A244]|nr:hypothetical protein C9J60_05150 [Streptomyces sp. A244]